MMDCPYFERLCYAGDAAVQGAILLFMGLGEPLVRRYLETYPSGRLENGYFRAASPGHGKGLFIIAFPLYWVQALHEYARWRGEKVLLRALMPEAVGQVERYLNRIDAEGNFRAPHGWTFCSWTFENPGAPRPDDQRRCGVHQLLPALTSRQMAELEFWMDDAAMVQRYFDNSFGAFPFEDQQKLLRLLITKIRVNRLDPGKDKIPAGPSTWNTKIRTNWYSIKIDFRSRKWLVIRTF